jgi:hypothetical protein
VIAAISHRVGQFWRHSAGRVAPAELDEAERILGSLMPLFSALPQNEQRHGLDVLQTVLRRGGSDRLLLQAALLHDLGKGEAGISVIERSLAVFLTATFPAGLEAWRRLLPSFRRRYAAYLDHAALGAHRLAAAGAEQLAAVVREHHDPHPKLEPTRRLREADGSN